MNSVKKRRRAVVDPSACVACGCCVKVCPLQAIEIVRGVMAQVRQDKCVGCGKCAESCPQHTIRIQEGKAVIDYKNCIRCFCCHEMCPKHVIDIKRWGLLHF